MSIDYEEDYMKLRENQKKVVIEIIRFIDDNSTNCFPQMDRCNFLDTFKGIIVKRNLVNIPDY